MNCTVCEGHVVRALEGICATEVSASYRRGDARCAVPGGVAARTITAAVQAAGYRVLGVEDVAPGGGGNCCG